MRIPVLFTEQNYEDEDERVDVKVLCKLAQELPFLTLSHPNAQSVLAGFQDNRKGAF